MTANIDAHDPARSFTMSGYRAMLEKFLEAGYAFRFFEDLAPGPTLLLRHDIDFSVPAALEMAKVEQELGVRSTYFFMLTSSLYNPFASPNREHIHAIKDMGHRVGIHFDPTVYSDMDAGFALEYMKMTSVFGESRMVSIHRPGPMLEDNNRALADCRHTYEDLYFKQTKYISDSRGAFHYGHPLDADAFHDRQPIHLLIHPVWWVFEGATVADKIRAWQRQHFEFLTIEAQRNCVAFDGIPFYMAQS